MKLWKFLDNITYFFSYQGEIGPTTKHSSSINESTRSTQTMRIIWNICYAFLCSIWKQVYDFNGPGGRFIVTKRASNDHYLTNVKLFSLITINHFLKITLSYPSSEVSFEKAQSNENVKSMSKENSLILNWNKICTDLQDTVWNVEMLLTQFMMRIRTVLLYTESKVLSFWSIRHCTYNLTAAAAAWSNAKLFPSWEKMQKTILVAKIFSPEQHFRFNKAARALKPWSWTTEPDIWRGCEISPSATRVFATAGWNGHQRRRNWTV